MPARPAGARGHCACLVWWSGARKLLLAAAGRGAEVDMAPITDLAGGVPAARHTQA